MFLYRKHLSVCHTKHKEKCATMKGEKRGRRKRDWETGRRENQNRPHNIFETNSSICAESCLPGTLHHWDSKRTLLSLFLQTVSFPPKNLKTVSLVTIFLETLTCASLMRVLDSHTLHDISVSASCPCLPVHLALFSLISLKSVCIS